MCRIAASKDSGSKSPVVYVGNGVRLAGRVEQFLSIVEKLNVPVVTAISGSDIIWHDHPLCFGKPGICGDRIGNIMVQNSDLLIVLGTRLSIRQISYAYDLLAPKAYKVMVDIDENELKKPTLSIDLPIHADLRDFWIFFRLNWQGHVFRLLNIGEIGDVRLKRIANFV